MEAELFHQTINELRAAFYWRGFWEGFFASMVCMSSLYSIASVIAQRRGR